MFIVLKKFEIKNKFILSVPIDTENIKKFIPEEFLIVSKVPMNVNNFFHKQKIFKQKDENNSGVYRIPWKDCESIYIGETSDFVRRKYQHNYALRIGDENCLTWTSCLEKS